ncbi:MAG: hypothetical protein QG608_3760 [Actinomycetota bacterium]|nr:hypothetical protein [Actinomycetota bacterium]
MSEDTTSRREADPAFAGVCEPRAEIFGNGAPFVRGWATARTASLGLAAQIRSAGLVDDFAGLRADVSVSGQGLVCLGTTHPDAVRLLAVLISRGLCAEMDGVNVA